MGRTKLFRFHRLGSMELRLGHHFRSLVLVEKIPLTSAARAILSNTVQSSVTIADAYVIVKFRQNSTENTFFDNTATGAVFVVSEVL